MLSRLADSSSSPDPLDWTRTTRWSKVAFRNILSVYCFNIPAGLEAYGERKHQIIKNFKHVLEEAGSSLDKIVKINVYITDMDNFAAMNEIYKQYFKTPNLPGRT
jgi:enamine deaminase RidA (YjgF/YER057c/UK114 family)